MRIKTVYTPYGPVLVARVPLSELVVFTEKRIEREQKDGDDMGSATDYSAFDTDYERY